MMFEIERKFLVTQEKFDTLQFRSDAIFEKFYNITQAYLVNRKDVVVRVRVDVRIGNKSRPPIAILCVKKPVDGSRLIRTEDEYEIDLEAAYGMMSVLPRLEKIRYRFGAYTFDVFQGDLKGLILAEREYETEEEALVDNELPDWAVRDVTEETTYLNSCLVGKKFINGTVA